MHHYQFNIGDYRKDTVHLSLLEHGIYRMLIDSYYANEGPLEADDEILMRTHCIRSADEQQAYKNVMKDFFKLEDGHYHHAGCDKVLEKIYAKSESARKSAEARWGRKNKGSMRTQCERNANGMRNGCEEDATHNPEPNNPIPNKKPKSENKFSNADREFAEYAYEQIKISAPKTKPPNLDRWANSVRLMREQDDLSHDEIRQVFDFSTRDSFWRTVILSVPKFREKFTQLHAKMINGGSNESRNGNYQKPNPADEALYRKYPHLRPQ